MDRQGLIRKVLAKLEEEPKLKKKLNKREALELLFDIIEKEDVVKTNYSEKLKISEEQHSTLRKIYDHGPVKKLYTYGLRKFGFNIENLRIDVDPAYMSAKRTDEELEE